jgi:hypothetical protein
MTRENSIDLEKVTTLGWHFSQQGRRKAPKGGPMDKYFIKGCERRLILPLDSFLSQLYFI